MLRFPVLLLAMTVAGAAGAQDSARLVRFGKTIAEKNCASCHAIGLKGASTRKGAPPFRTLHRRYDLDNLQEALVEGVAVGHRGADMPEFTFTPGQTDALIAYLKSLKGR